RFYYTFMSVNRNIPLPEKKRPYIIHSHNVICMFMSKENTINTLNVIGKHLLSKVRTTIYNITELLPLYHNGNAKPLIFYICTVGYGIVTPNDGDALRGSCP